MGERSAESMGAARSADGLAEALPEAVGGEDGDGLAARRRRSAGGLADGERWPMGGRAGRERSGLSDAARIPSPVPLPFPCPVRGRCRRGGTAARAERVRAAWTARGGKAGPLAVGGDASGNRWAARPHVGTVRDAGRGIDGPGLAARLVRAGRWGTLADGRTGRGRAGRCVREALPGAVGGVDGKRWPMGSGGHAGGRRRRPFPPMNPGTIPPCVG